MELKIVKTNKEFNQLYGYLMDKYEVLTQLLFINTKDESIVLDQKNSRGAVMEDDEVLLVFLDANPYKLQLFGLKNSIEATALLVDYLIDNDIEIKGILGSHFDTDLFVNEYLEKSKNKVFFNVMSMDIMVLKKLKPVQLNGKLKRPTENDEALVQGYINDFIKEALPLEYDPSIIKGLAKSFVKDKHAYIFYNEEDIPTSIVKTIPYKRGYRVNMVFTDYKHRSKGYATSMMYLVCNLLLKENNVEYISLYVDKSNPVSNSVYEHVGFKVIRDQYDFVLKSI